MKNEVIKQVSFVGLLGSSLTATGIKCKDYATIITTDEATGDLPSKQTAIESSVFSFDDATKMLSVDASELTADHKIRLYAYIV